MTLAKSLQSAAGNAAGEANYIEDVFSTWLYTGNGSTQTITNGIDLAGEGGLVWQKLRDTVTSHALIDTARGGSYYIESNSTFAQDPAGATTFNSNGYSLGSGNGRWNGDGYTYASWTFRQQPKFFQVVTWTGDSTAGRQIGHNLGSAPGCMIVKRTDTGDGWMVYHRSTNLLILNSNSSEFGVPATAERFGDDTNVIAPTSSVFTLGTNGSVNASGGTYVAYLFAHDAGGFGLSGEDNVISCGSFTTDGSGDATVTLGYEPQLVLMKYSSQSSDWMILDNMRGFRVTGNASPGNNGLFPNLSNAESTSNATISTYVDPTATGFIPIGFGPSKTIIYIAIRRGPMKVPESGTSVYDAKLYTGAGTNPVTISGISMVPDFVGNFVRNYSTGQGAIWFDRLRGGTRNLEPRSTSAENAETAATATFDKMTTVTLSGGDINATSYTYVNHFLKRAPSVFDEVCYTGDGTFDGSYNVNHNLGVAPEFIIAKRRNSTNNWNCYHSGLTSATYQIRLNLTAGQQNTGQSWGPTSTTFKPQYSGNADNSSNVNTGTYVAYLFSTCAGVSKVGSYTGTATTLQVDCGFTAGARFVLIKRIDDNGDWYVWDSARGIVAGNDSYLLLNSTAAEVTSTDYIDTYSAGFEISSTAPAAINASGGTFVFLAIA